MSRTSPDLQLEEIPGSRHPDRVAVQRAARLELASDLAATLRAMLADGRLVQRDGRIEPNE